MDLNLLRIFDALMEHRSVTRAAGALGVTQPAVSHALARLRRTLDDPLFIRAQSGLQPTTRAEEIAGGVRRGLLQFQNALAPTEFDPATVKRHFTVAAGSYFCALLIPALVERIREEAPGISLRLVPSSEVLIPMLDKGGIDLALGTAVKTPDRIMVEPLYREAMVWIAAPHGALVRNRTGPDQVGDSARIFIAPRPPFDMPGKFEAEEAEGMGEWPPPVPVDNRFTVYDSQTAVALVERTDLIALVPEKVAALAIARGQVVALDWAREGARYEMALIWHRRHRFDQGLGWLRARVREVAGYPEEAPFEG